MHGRGFVSQVSHNFLSRPATRVIFFEISERLDVEDRADIRREHEIENRSLVDAEHLKKRFVKKNDRAHQDSPSVSSADRVPGRPAGRSSLSYAAPSF